MTLRPDHVTQFAGATRGLGKAAHHGAQRGDERQGWADTLGTRVIGQMGRHREQPEHAEEDDAVKDGIGGDGGARGQAAGEARQADARSRPTAG